MANSLFLSAILLPILTFMGISVYSDNPNTEPIACDTIWVSPLFNRTYLDEYDFLKPPPLHITRQAHVRTLLQVAAAGTVTNTTISQGDSTLASFCCHEDFYDITDLKTGSYKYSFGSCHIAGSIDFFIDK